MMQCLYGTKLTYQGTVCALDEYITLQKEARDDQKRKTRIARNAWIGCQTLWQENIYNELPIPCYFMQETKTIYTNDRECTRQNSCFFNSVRWEMFVGREPSQLLNWYHNMIWYDIHLLRFRLKYISINMFSFIVKLSNLSLASSLTS